MLTEKLHNNDSFKKHTTTPTTTGSSIVAIKFDKGVVIAADTRMTQHGYKKYNDITRIAPVNKNTIMGCSGEYSDFQELNRILVEKAQDDELYDGVNSFIGPKELSHFLSFNCYQQRNKMNPYWNTTMIGGILDDGTPYLNSVDQFGTRYENCYLVSGFGLYFGGPILENSVPKDHTKITKEQAIDLIDKVFRVLFYRDSTAGNRIYYGIIEKNLQNTVEFNLVEKKLETNWEYDLFKKSHTERYHSMAN